MNGSGKETPAKSAVLTPIQSQCLRDCQGGSWHPLLHPMTIGLKISTVKSLAKLGYLETKPGPMYGPNQTLYTITEDGRAWRRNNGRDD